MRCEKGKTSVSRPPDTAMFLYFLNDSVRVLLSLFVRCAPRCWHKKTRQAHGRICGMNRQEGDELKRIYLNGE